METQLVNGKERVVWLDVVRFAAMFMVICCHCTDPFNFGTGDTPNMEAYKFWGAVYGSFVRVCVPLFAMITGALLLPVRQDTGMFYRRRISRVLYPFIIWSVLYCLFPWITGLLRLSPDVITQFFPCAKPMGEAAQSFAHSFDCMIGLLTNFSIYGIHMWYIYMLIGLYLYMPIFSAWIEKASERAKLLFLALWGVTLFLPYYHILASEYIWGECSWNAFSTFYYFAGFNGYLLLGHYLRRHEYSMRTTLLVAIPMFVVGFCITFFGFRWMTAKPDITEPMYEMFFTFCSINVMMMTAAAFLLLKKVRVTNNTVCRLLANLTLCGFGVYMVHYFFVGPTVMLARAIGTPIPLQIPVASVFTFIGSWLIIAIIRRIAGRYARIVVG